MPEILKAQLADLKGGTRIKFNPGDRMIAKVITDLNPDQRRRIRNSVEKFAGEPIRIIIVNCLHFRIVKEQLDKQCISICDERDLQHKDQALNCVNLRCSIINFQPNERLFVFHKGWKNLCASARRNLYQSFEEWTGDEVEVIISDSLL